MTSTVPDSDLQDKYSYNWPYDFFSMVELIKLDAEVEFSNVDEALSKESKKLVTKQYFLKDEN